MARLEAALVQLPAGPVDLLRAVLAVLASEAPLPQLPDLILAEPEAVWPGAWRRLFELLKERGIRIAPVAGDGHASPGSDLSHFQTFISDPHAPSGWSGDGSITLVTSEGETEAADALAAWLANVPGSEVTLVKDGGGGLLDAAMRARHLPRVGGRDGGDASAPALLALALAVRWEPFDAAEALAFLSLPCCPLGRASRHLARAIEEMPGRGGPAWLNAVQAALEERRDRTASDGADAQRIRSRVSALKDDIAFWLPEQRHARDRGLPASEVLMVCGRLAALSRANGDQALAAAAAGASILARAVETSGLDRLTPRLLARMLDSVAEAAILALPGEASPWCVARSPGQVLESTGTLVWWVPDAPGGPPGATWRPDEMAWLRSQRVPVERGGDVQRRERASWMRAVRMARERLVLVRPRIALGQVAAPHPVLSELQLAFGDASDRIPVEATELRSGRITGFAGARLPLTPIASSPPPRPRREWQVPPGAVAPRETESPTGMEAMLGCPLAWTLKYAAALRAHGPAMLPDTDRMLGTFLHLVMQRLFVERPAWERRAVETRARSLFDELLPQAAAPLLMPGMEATLERAREDAVRSLGRLAELFGRAELELEGVEVEVARPVADGATMRGAIDVLLRRPDDGRRVVVDAKWSRSASRHRKMLETNKAIQLAAYVWLTEEEGRPRPSAAYFLLRQNRMHSANEDPFTEAAVPNADVQRTWFEGLATYRALYAAVAAGSLEASGVPGGVVAIVEDAEDGAKAAEDPFAPPLLRLEPPCGYCDYRGLCGATAARGGR